MASVVIELSADEAKAFRAFTKLEAKSKDVESGLKRLGQAGRKAGQEVEQSFGGKAASMLTSHIASIVSVSAAWGGAKAAMAAYRAEKEKAMGSFMELQAPEQRLAQIATSAEDLQAMRATADRIAVNAGVTREEARQFLFSARSEGFAQQAEALAANAIVVPLESQAIVAGQLPSMYKNKITPVQSVAATLAAAEASRLDFSAIARAAPQAAEGSILAGSSPAESLAMLSVLASEFKSGDTAADRIKAFGVKAGLDMPGLGVMGAVKKLRAMPESEREDFLGTSAELNVAYSKLSSNLELIEERRAMIEKEIALAGSAQSRLTQKRVAAFKVFGTRQAVESAKARSAIASEPLGVGQAEFEAARDTALAELQQSGAGAARRMIAKTAAEQAANLGKSPSQVRGIVGGVNQILEDKRFARASKFGDPTGLGSIIFDLIKAVDRLTQKSEKAAQQEAVTNNLARATQSMERAVKAMPAQGGTSSGPSASRAPASQRELNAVERE